MNARLILLLPALLLVACASGKSGDVYTRDQVRQMQTYKVGVIEGLRDVRIEGTKSGVGAVAGAVAGGIAGSGVDKGKTGQVAAVVGAVVGGVAGAAAEEGLTRENGLEFDIKLEDGSHVSIVQEKSVTQETFKVGDRVRVIQGYGATRVAH